MIEVGRRRNWVLHTVEGKVLLVFCQPVEEHGAHDGLVVGLRLVGDFSDLEESEKLCQNFGPIGRNIVG